MRIIRHLEACPADCKGAVLALGNFDGVHLGHQAILRQCVETARKKGVPAAAMTFEPHPREFFARHGAHSALPLRLYKLRQKIELIADQGIDILFLIRFDRRFSATTAEFFIEDVLHRQLAVRHVVTGYNFAFGHKRQGNAGLLTNEAQKLGFGFAAVSAVKDDLGEDISSSAIREALARGDLIEAQRMLGRPYRISGHVIHGDKRGRELGFPTANLSLGRLFRPRYGIYAARMGIEQQPVRHHAVVNLGIRPMFSLAEPLLEAHVFDLKEDLYGKRIHLDLVRFIRDEKNFGSVSELRVQMNDDCAQARIILAEKELHKGVA